MWKVKFILKAFIDLLVALYIELREKLFSQAELDEAETLDPGDRCDLAANYVALREALPNLSIVGGCCGTDFTHIEQIATALFEAEPVC